MVKKVISDIDRFDSQHVKLSCGCWVSLITAGRHGAHGHIYPAMTIGSRTNNTRKTVTVSRWLYEQLHGPIPPGMLVCHTCDIPECVNPDHLWLGTVKDNVDDMRAKGRNNYTGPNKPYKGPKAWSAKLTAEQVREMRQLFATGEWTKAALAERYGIHRVSVIGILRGDYWKHV